MGQRLGIRLLGGGRAKRPEGAVGWLRVKQLPCSFEEREVDDTPASKRLRLLEARVCMDPEPTVLSQPENHRYILRLAAGASRIRTTAYRLAGVEADHRDSAAWS